jgi:hypothetical protein
MNTTVNAATVNVFPVPAQDVLNISFKNTTPQAVSAEVMDVMGKTLLSNELLLEKQNAASAVDINALAEGVYFLTLRFNDGSVEKIKFIKQ